MTTRAQKESMTDSNFKYNGMDSISINESQAMILESQRLIDESMKLINKLIGSKSQ